MPVFSKKSKLRSFVVNLGKGFVVFIAALLTYEYLPVSIYDFAEPAPFTGDKLYNPYSDKGEWLKSNFHIHAHAWGGIPNGHQEGKEIIERYEELGYDIIAVSDYYRLNPDMRDHAPLHIRAYEHGTDVNKTHRLVLGASKVDYYDISYSPNINQKQYLLERLGQTAPVVAMAHPCVRNGHPAAMCRHFTGYDLLEVANRHRLSLAHWDSALSAGKAVWALASDDIHDMDKEIEGSAWTMVRSKEKTEAAVLNALSKGNTYGVGLKDKFPDEVKRKVAAQLENRLLGVQVEGMQCKWVLEKPAEQIRLIGQGGEVLKTFQNTACVNYTFDKKDTYVRMEVEQAHSVLYINPIIRYSGDAIPRNTFQATVNLPKTAFYKASILTADLLLFLLLYGKFIFRWRPFTRPSPVKGDLETLPELGE